MKPKIYIDGSEGTTGLRIFERVGCRDDIEILTIDPSLRKDVDERKKLINQSDITFLCLPDAAAKEAVTLVDNDTTKIIDASTAHRVHPDWAYGFAELSPAHREAIATGKRIANPGCHATGFISLVYPLVAAGVLPKETVTTCFSLTGYSGGGKKMIAQYGDEARDAALDSPRIYGLTHSHKHLPEMQKICGLDAARSFPPSWRTTTRACSSPCRLPPASSRAFPPSRSCTNATPTTTPARRWFASCHTLPRRTAAASSPPTAAPAGMALKSTSPATTNA